MTERRKIRDEQDARACVEAAATAGMEVGAWARAHGVDGRSLNTWRLNLARREKPARSRIGSSRAGASSAEPQRLRLVEVVPAPRGEVAARYVVRVGGVEVEVGDGFRDETLRRMVGVLRSC